MAITPWEISDRFTQYLANKRLQESRLGAAHEENVYRQNAAADRASTLFGRQLARDEINQGNMIERLGISNANATARAEAQRRFQHNENYLTHVKYKTEAFNEMMKGINGEDMTGDPTAQPSSVDPTTTGSVGGGGGGATDASGRVTPQSAYAYLTGQGMPPMVAAGIVGNIDVETGWDQAVFTGQRMGDQGTAGYSGQWRGPRLQHLYEFAQSRGHNAPTPEDQLDFYYEEARTGRDAGARQAFEAASQAQTPEEAAHAFMSHYERPNPQYANADRRMSAARAIYGSGGAGAAPATTQRRYGMQAAPDAAYLPSDDMSQYADPEDDPAMQDLLAQEEDAGQQEADFVAPEDVAWGEEDYAANGVDPMTTAAVPDDMDVVGQGYYSDSAIQLMPESMQTRLLPTPGTSGDAANKYLIMKPKPLPQAPAPVQNVPTGQRTRRNDQGQLEVNIDGAWQTTGG